MEQDPLVPVVNAIRTVSSDRPEPEVYHAVLSVLLDEMSFRAVARAIELAWGVDRIDVLHDVAGIKPYGEMSQHSVLAESVKARLVASGVL
jgi:hypothetical protein